MDHFVSPLRWRYLHFSSPACRPLLHCLHRHLELLLRCYAQDIFCVFRGRLLDDLLSGAEDCTRTTLLVFISVTSVHACGENCNVCVLILPLMMCAGRWLMVTRAPISELVSITPTLSPSTNVAWLGFYYECISYLRRFVFLCGLRLLLYGFGSSTQIVIVILPQCLLCMYTMTDLCEG